jgi:hypothetical protein
MKRLYFVVLCVFLLAHASAQTKKRKAPQSFNKQNKDNDQFLRKQWWLGFKAGGNLSKVDVDKTYAVISPTNYESKTINKKYDNFKQWGSQATLEVTFYFSRFCVSFQPTYQHARFAYSNHYEWTNNGDPQLILDYQQEQKVDHAILPLLVKYEITGDKLRPYVQAGVYSAVLLNATKNVTVSGEDYASGGINKFKDEPVIVGAKDLFAKNHWGILGGAGVYYNLGNVRLNLDVIYRQGMSNISSTKNRYTSDRLSGVGDALDDLSLKNISVSAGALFPLRFLASGFKSLERK